MENEITNLFEDSMNISEIGKYHPFVKVVENMENVSSFEEKINGTPLIKFKSNYLFKEKFDSLQGHFSLLDMEDYLKKKIIKDIQSKIDKEEYKFLKKKNSLIDKALKKSKEYAILKSSILKNIEQIKQRSLEESSTSLE